MQAIADTKRDMESSEDYGPPDLRRCRIREDGDSHPCSIQGGSGGKTGGVSGSYDNSCSSSTTIPLSSG